MIAFADFRSRWSNFWFKTLFPGQYAHMGHLVDDVIRLEKERVRRKDVVTITGTSTHRTYDFGAVKF